MKCYACNQAASPFLDYPTNRFYCFACWQAIQKDLRNEEEDDTMVLSDEEVEELIEFGYRIDTPDLS